MQTRLASLPASLPWNGSGGEFYDLKGVLTMFCMSCGAKLPSSAMFCPVCGQKIKEFGANDDTEVEAEEPSDSNVSDDEESNDEDLEVEDEADSMEESSDEESDYAWLEKVYEFLIGKALCFLFVGVALFLVVFWWRTGSSPGKLVANPPITVQARTGFLSDAVVQVRNNSSDVINVYVAIYQGSLSDETYGVDIGPGETKEFGWLEFKNHWKPKSGNKGFVAVRGYGRTACFKLIGDRYTTRFECGIPDDYPNK